jgi:hypothetical protein
VTDPDDAGNIYIFGSGTSSVRPAIAADRAEAVTDALDRILGSEPGNGASTADALETVATELTRDSESANGRDQARLRALAETVRRLAESLR